MQFRFRAVFAALIIAALLAPPVGQMCANALGLCGCGHWHGKACCCLRSAGQAPAEGDHCDTGPAAHHQEAHHSEMDHQEAGGPPDRCQLRREGGQPASTVPFADPRPQPGILDASPVLAAAARGGLLPAEAPPLPLSHPRSPERPPPRLDAA